jgi:hypothetical protein
VGGIVIVILSLLGADTAPSHPFPLCDFPNSRWRTATPTFLAHQYYIGTLHNLSLETETLCIGLPMAFLLLAHNHADIAYSGVFDARCPLAQTRRSARVTVASPLAL